MQSLLVLLLVSVSARVTCAAHCACATAPLGVNVRDGAGTSHSILTALEQGQCLPFKNHRQTVNGESWVNVDYNGQDGWMHEGFVTISTCASTGTNSHLQLPGCPHIISRAEWGARAPNSPPVHLPATPKYMFIHHGASAPCYTKAACIQKVKEYQNYHIDGHAICTIRNFMDHPPNDQALNVVKQLIQCAHDNHKITSNYILRGHRDMGSNSCPGDKYYELIKHWPHY